MSELVKSEALVLVPGLMCDRSLWRHQLPELEKQLPVMVAEHGASDSLPRMAQQLLLQAPQRFALAGFSMGGRVALEVMRQAPERVTHLALLSTGCRAVPEGNAGDKERELRLGFLRLAREQGLGEVAEVWACSMVHPTRLSGDATLLAEVAQMFGRQSLATYAAQINALLNRGDASALLPHINCPTLVLCGDKDAHSSVINNQEMAAAIPQAQLVVIPHCGHMVMLERPAPVLAALQAWLRR